MINITIRFFAIFFYLRKHSNVFLTIFLVRGKKEFVWWYLALRALFIQILYSDMSMSLSFFMSMSICLCFLWLTKDARFKFRVRFRVSLSCLWGWRKLGRILVEIFPDIYLKNMGYVRNTEIKNFIISPSLFWTD